MADVAYVRMTNCSFGYTAFAADMFARRIVGRAYATAMGIGGLPLRALEQAVSWAASHGGADGLVHRSGHGARCIGLVYVTGVGEFGMLPPTGTVGDSCGNAMAGGGRRWRVQDRACLAAQALPGFEGPGTGDVPVVLVAGT